MNMNIVLDILGLLIALRFLLPLMQVSYYNPVSQFVARFSRWSNYPFGFLPTYLSGRLDLAALVALVGWYVLVNFLVQFFMTESLVFYPQYLLFGFGSAILIVLNLLFVAIIASVLLSWVAPFTQNPLAQIAVQISRGACAPIRRILPSLGGLDFSPVFALFLIIILRNNLVSGFPVYRPLRWLLDLL